MNEFQPPDPVCKFCEDWCFGTCEGARERHEEPAVLGAGGGPAPMPTEEDRKAAWRSIYMATMMKHAGLDEIAAKDCYDAGSGDYDFTDDPELAALEEMEYWTDDGDC